MFNNSLIEFEECPEYTSKYFLNNNVSRLHKRRLFISYCRSYWRGTYAIWLVTYFRMYNVKHEFYDLLLNWIIFATVVTKWRRSTSTKFHQEAVNHCISFRSWKNTIRAHPILDRYNLWWRRGKLTIHWMWKTRFKFLKIYLI